VTNQELAFGKIRCRSNTQGIFFDKNEGKYYRLCFFIASTDLEHLIRRQYHVLDPILRLEFQSSPSYWSVTKPRTKSLSEKLLIAKKRQHAFVFELKLTLIAGAEIIRAFVTLPRLLLKKCL